MNGKQLFQKMLPLYMAFHGLFISNAWANPMNTPSAQAPQPITVMPITIIPSNEPPEWRDFRELSAHPNGEDIFFVECHKDLPEICRVLRLNLKTRALTYYALPTGYFYPEVYVSPSGKKLALIRVALEFRALPGEGEHREIAIMNTDGNGFEVLPLAPGPKTMPKFNASDDRLAFWRAKLRKPGSKTVATSFDVYEYDFKTGKETAFGPSYRFFQRGNIQYVPGGDDLLVNPDAPPAQEGRLGMDLHGYIKRYPNNIFRLQRGQAHWVAPLFADAPFEGLSKLVLSRDGALVFYATPHKVGSTSIYRHDAGGGFFKWSRGEGQDSTWAVFGTASLLYSALIDNKLIGIFSNYAAQGNLHLKRFLTLDMQSGEWRAMNIPPLSTATAVPVSMK